MLIREATDGDWPAVHPFFRAVVDAGHTYAYPEGLSLEDARPLWMEQPPGRTVVAVDGDTVLGSAKTGPNRPGRGSHIATASFLVAPAVHLWRSLGFQVLATVPGAYDHPEHGYVGLHVMFLDLVGP